MSDEHGDRLLNLLGAVLALFIVVGLVGVVLAGMGGPSTSAESAPEADWSLERVNDSHVRLAHAGGDPVPASDLVVTVDGVRRRASWDGLVRAGDTGTVHADRGMLVQLYWTTERGERIKLDEWTGS
jgi:FlaG/FlaF family flagellin (archaellin)